MTTIKTFLNWTLFIIITIILYWFINKALSTWIGIPMVVKLEGTTEWIISNTNKVWITVQRSDLTNLSPFLLTNDWEGGLLNELDQTLNFWPKGFRVMSDPSLSLISHSVPNGEMSRVLFYQFYSESVLSHYTLYNKELGLCINLEDIWPEKGLRLPFKSEISTFEKEVEPNIIQKINYFRSEEWSLKQNKIHNLLSELSLSQNKNPNKISLKMDYETLKKLISVFKK